MAFIAALAPVSLDYIFDEDVNAIVYSIALTVIATGGTALFAGCAEEMVHRFRAGEEHAPLRVVLSKVPAALWPLTAVSVLQGLGVALGFVLLIVPGFVLLSWWSVAGPVVVAERTTARRALGRSRELVRGNGWRVFGVVFIALLVSGGLASLIQLIGEASGLDHEGEVSLAIGEGLTLPLEGLAIPVMYWRLRAMKES